MSVENYLPVRRPKKKKKQSALGRLSRTRAGYRTVAGVTRLLRDAVVRLGPERGPGLASAVARRLSPLLPETRVARANLKLAFPEKSEAEREAILAGAWDNLARTMAEMTLLPTLLAEEDRFEIVGREHLERLRDDGKPGLVFSAHLGNWEFTGNVAAQVGLPLTAIFRKPANPYIAEDLVAIRGEINAPLVPNSRRAAQELMAVLRRGGHGLLLIDQRPKKGITVPFFGTPVPTNDLLARFARILDCPVVGAKTTRLPGTRFRLEFTPPLDLPRDDGGRIDAAAATHMMTGMIEDWVRAHPEQWMWQHNRWGRSA